MKYAMEERIGDPHLFVGRHKELNDLLKWIEGIKIKSSKSKALLARRKMGKTAMMERLFNLTFHQNDGVIPFYYEVKEMEMWVVDFCLDFFQTFAYQYIAFKTRNTNYLNPIETATLLEIADAAEKENLRDMAALCRSVYRTSKEENGVLLWDMVRNAPKRLAARNNERIVQMIDEFQFLNEKIYWDKAFSNQAHDLAGGYLSTAESKVAPLLVSGSWVGWLLNMLVTMLPARFKYIFPANMPEDEAVEMIYKYSRFYDVPVTEETTYLITQLAEGNPFYIAAIMNSAVDEKDLTTVEGLLKTLEFETQDNRGDIKYTWMEYIQSAFSRVNDKNAKNIVLYLCKNRDREVTRPELIEKLALDMTDSQLEEKLKKLVKADIIQQGSSNFRYQGVNDNIFDKVFRGVYQEEIEAFDPKEIKQELSRELHALQKELHTVRGKLNYQKGYFAEYVILDKLMHRGVKNNDLLKSITHNLPQDFSFCRYETAWTYRTAVTYAKGLSVDVLARPTEPGNYSIVGEIKNRDTKKFNKEEAEAFFHKLEIIRGDENLDPVVGFIFSRKGFTKEAVSFLEAKGIAYSEDERWLD